MNKALLVILMCILPVFVHAQKIHFVDTTNLWKIVYANVGDPTPEFYYGTEGVCCDTIINAKDYKGGPGGFIREDTIAGKVYRLDPVTDSETVFMDYNLVLGDTLRIDSFIHIVDNIDSTMIGGLWYKVWHFSPISSPGSVEATDYTVVEGVGCVQSPSFIFYPIILFETYVDVYCFSNRGTTPPLSPGVGSLDNVTSCTLSINQIKTPAHSIAIYPNPTTTILNVSSGDAITTLSINNIVGATYYSIACEAKEVKINVAAFPAGVYYLKINGSDVRKFIKK